MVAIAQKCDLNAYLQYNSKLYLKKRNQINRTKWPLIEGDHIQDADDILANRFEENNFTIFVIITFAHILDT